ncbi:MAG: hypothetical protein OXM01_01395 [Gemmatimonadota bacterium]|nr:hypothetical protein [Gemmatimonadota bacterium]
MTTDEEHTEIGRMYVEREEVERKLACLSNKSRRDEKLLRAAADALEARRKGSGPVGLNEDLPTREAIRTLLDDMSKLQARLRELESFFASRRK